MRKLTRSIFGLLVVAACGAGDSAGTTTTVGATTSTATVTVATTTAEATTSTLVSSTTTAQAIDVRFEAGQVEGPDRFTVTLGEKVSIWVFSDVDEEVHVHGYDLTFPVMADVPVEISLAADVPGIFEVELEESATPLFELEVTR